MVHGVGGMAGMVAMYFLGPRRGSLQSEHQQSDLNLLPKTEEEREKSSIHKLIPIQPAKQPILMVMGAFVLWYGWFSFNITSPIVANIEAGGNLAQSGLNTFLAPCCSACTCLFYVKLKNYMTHTRGIISFEDLLSCILAGLVCVTGACYTIEYWAACICGVCVVPLYFIVNWYVREKLMIDDPLCISSVHLAPGFLGFFLEGILILFSTQILPKLHRFQYG